MSASLNFRRAPYSGQYVFQMEWRDKREYSPEAKQFVLAYGIDIDYGKQPVIRLCQYHINEHCSYFQIIPIPAFRDNYYLGNVTHWMPLPGAPTFNFGPNPGDG